MEHPTQRSPDHILHRLVAIADQHRKHRSLQRYLLDGYECSPNNLHSQHHMRCDTTTSWPTITRKTLEFRPRRSLREFDCAGVSNLDLGVSLFPSVDTGDSEHHELECIDQRRRHDFSACILYPLWEAGLHWAGCIGESDLLSSEILPGI